MSEHLQHDPRTKQQIKDLLYTSLYDPVQKQFKARLDGIISKNSSLITSSHGSFIYKGEFYTNDPNKPPMKMNRLVAQLRPQMDEYLKDLKQLNDYELPYVLGFINQVLNSSNSLQDYIRILPESMHQPLKQLIDTCPCRQHVLTEAKIKELHDKNQESINMIKQRMVRNLIT